MNTLLMTGFLLMGAIAIGTLVQAARHAKDGCENESGFYRPKSPQSESGTQAETDQN